MDDNLLWLINWYHKKCEDNQYRNCKSGIEISTIDNPGWYLRINLEKTALLDRQFQKIEIDRSEHDWVRCFIKDEVLEGVGGPFNLLEVLQIFRLWVLKDEGPINHDDDLVWLLNWYYNQCDGDWEHGSGIKIKTTEGSGWFFRVSVRETDLGDKNFQVLDMARSKSDWVRCSIENGIFQGSGGPFNLLELLKIFRIWAEG